MKKILHISPSLSVKGGISALLQYFCNTDLANNYELVFVASHKDGSRFYKAYVALIGLLRMTLLLMRKKIDVVHIHCGDIVSHSRKYLFFRVAKFFNRKVILHLHGALFIEHYKNAPPAWQRRIRKFYLNSDLVICLSKSWEKNIGLLFTGSNRIVIPNGIPIPRLNRENDKPGKEIKLIFLGLIGPRKGIFDLLKAVKRMVDEGLPVRLFIGGNGEIDKMKDIVQKDSLQNHVEYVGWVNRQERELFLQGTDIFVLPSYGEGMPMSILEAMSYSIPVVSTWVGGIPELVSDGHTGFLVNPGDVDELYLKIRQLVLDGDARVQMGKNARSAVEINHNIESIARKVGQVYDSECLLSASSDIRTA